jgi:hypothetical protein
MAMRSFPVVGSFVLAKAMLFKGPAFADSGEDYAACLIGHAVIALDAKQANDATSALAIANRKCPKPMASNRRVRAVKPSSIWSRKSLLR